MSVGESAWENLMSIRTPHPHMSTTDEYDGVNGVTSVSLSFTPSSFSLLYQVLRQASNPDSSPILSNPRHRSVGLSLSANH